MKKLLTGLLIIPFIMLLVTGCSVLGRVTDFSGDKDETIINSYRELDEIIAYLSDNFVMSEKVKLKNKEIWDDLDRYYDENPDVLISRGIKGMEISYTTGLSGVLNAEVKPQYEMYMKVLIARETGDMSLLTVKEMQVFTKAEEIVGSLSGMSTFDKVDGIHSYLIENIKYDDNYENNENAFDVYGALIEGIAVCQGYTQSFQMLADMAGVESLIVTGDAGGESHAWNLVNFGNGEWYHIDATWNDREGTRSHRYFNVSDSIMNSTHNWKKSDYPAANGVKYNYYRYKGIMAASLQNLESKFASMYTNEDGFYEILCAFPVTSEDLDFLHDYKTGESVMYSIEDYDNDSVLLTVML